MLVDVSFWHYVWIRPLFQRKKSCDIPTRLVWKQDIYNVKGLNYKQSTNQYIEN